MTLNMDFATLPENFDDTFEESLCTGIKQSYDPTVVFNCWQIEVTDISNGSVVVDFRIYNSNENGALTADAVANRVTSLVEDGWF